MKKICVALLCFVFAFTLFGAENPKALAQEAFELMRQMMADINDPAKMAEIAKRAEALEARLEKLSEKDKALVDEELMKLMAADPNIDELLNMFEDDG